jgi:hypothetical protein
MRIIFTLSFLFLPHVFAESHPFRERLRCDRASGSTLRAHLFDTSTQPEVKIAEFGRAPIGTCELAIRNARNDSVCIERSHNYELIKISTRETLTKFGRDITACLEASHGLESLKTETGFVEFMAESERNLLLKNLPQTQDDTINTILNDPQTMWYDETSMVFVYQDSFGDPKGLRANRVGFDVGHNNDVPDIKALTQYFEHGRFKFPFGITAGVDFTKNEHVFYFWHAPKDQDKVIPVAYWNNKSHLHWSFPEGTVFGEVLSLKAPDDEEWYVYEIRVRERVADQWRTSIYRPFLNADEMADAISELRPLAKQIPDLSALISHLKSASSLEPRTLATGSYSKIVPDFVGAADYLPPIKDYALIKSFLKDRIYKNAMGGSWKKSSTLETFAASTKADFHIVPKSYLGGMFETSEASCKRCHDQTSRPFGHLESRIVLYGEIWGEEEIFTWHPFAISDDSFGVTDNNRRINQRMLSAGLIRNFKPSAKDRHYKIMTMPFDAVYDLLPQGGGYSY